MRATKILSSSAGVQGARVLRLLLRSLIGFWSAFPRGAGFARDPGGAMTTEQRCEQLELRANGCCDRTPTDAITGWAEGAQARVSTSRQRHPDPVHAGEPGASAPGNRDRRAVVRPRCSTTPGWTRSWSMAFVGTRATVST